MIYCDECQVNDIENFTWIEPLKKTIEERLSKPDSHTIWLVDNKVLLSCATFNALMIID